MSALPEVKNPLKNLERIKNPSNKRQEYLRLDKNESTIPFPEDFILQLREEITADFLSVYPELEPFYCRLARWLEVEESSLYIAAGSDAAIKAVFEVFIEPGDNVVLISPTYAMYYVYTKMFDGRLVEIDFPEGLDLKPSDVLEVLEKNKIKLLCIANPNSPTGTIFSSSDLVKIIDAAEKKGTIVIIDEAYYGYYNNSAVSLISRYKNIVITRTFSKALGFASARVGIALGSREMIAALHKVRPMYEINAFGARCISKMLDRPEIIENNISLALEGKRYLEQELSRIGVPYFMSYANFILIDVGSFKRSAAIVQEMRNRKILIGGPFRHPCINSCIRVTVGSKGQMESFFNNLLDILNQ